MRWLLAFAILGCSSRETETPVVTDAAADVTADVSADVAGEVSADVGGESPPQCRLLKPFSSKNAACNDCAERECCAAINACLADKRCDDDYVNCSLACALLPADAGDAGAEKERCLNECGAMHPDGKALYDAAFGCTDVKCAAVCG